jgi:hypothetical protein
MVVEDSRGNREMLPSSTSVRLIYSCLFAGTDQRLWALGSAHAPVRQAGAAGPGRCNE